MSKVVIYVLDKIVWMLLITAVTTQALQIAGVVEAPKSLGEITYPQSHDYNFQLQVGDPDVRGKRQADHRSEFIDNLFNIPISTLTAVNNFVQSARPAIQSFREYASKRLERANKAAQKNIQLQQAKSRTVTPRSVDENATKP